ncbi:MAG: UDP-N-acetylglucosamine 2-epimerase, partial [Acidobacteriaceae bacterium]
IEQDTTVEAAALFAALEPIAEEGNTRILFCYPNADAGSRLLIERSRAFLAHHPASKLFVNLDAVTYWSLLRCVETMIGNSSSGIMETASFALPAVDIGLRQKGRERVRNVLDAEPDATAILARIEEARSYGFRASLAGMTNPYGDGHAAERIVDVLTTCPLGQELLIKRAMALPGKAS